MDKVVIVIPTYNEAINIKKTLEISTKEFKDIKNFDVHILVIDANSPDGTSLIVREFLKNHSKVHLITKPKGGLGADYITGFKYAMEKLSADFVGEMDADLQHDPQDVKRLLAAIDKGADVAVGTRFIKGGSIPKNWGMHRKFLSIFGNVYARFGTGMWHVHDLTSGFRITRVKGFLEVVKLDRLYSKRFAYKMDLYYRLFKLRAHIAEVPIKFHERQKGKSKIEVFAPLGTNDWLDSYSVITMILLERLHLITKLRFLKVAIIGIIGGGVQFTAYFILRELLNAAPSWANVISVELAVLSNFILNYHLAFKDRKGGNIFVKIITFHLSSAGSIIIQLAVFQFGLRLIGGGLWLEYIYQITGIWVGLIWNYFAYTNIVWQKK